MRFDKFARNKRDANFTGSPAVIMHTTRESEWMRFFGGKKIWLNKHGISGFLIIKCILLKTKEKNLKEKANRMSRFYI